MPLVQQIKATYSNEKVFYTFSMGVCLMFWQQWTGTNVSISKHRQFMFEVVADYTFRYQSINYYAPQIFKSVGLAGQSAGLFATGICTYKFQSTRSEMSQVMC